MPLLTGLRRRLADARKRPSPAGSLIDFGVWLVRHGLSPRHSRLFWLAVLMAGAGIASFVFLPYDTATAFGLVICFGLLTISLVLSYSRTLLNMRLKEMDETRADMNRAILETHTLRKDVQSGLAHLQSRLDKGLALEEQKFSGKLASQREHLEGRIDKIDERILRLAGEAEQRLEETARETLAGARQELQQHSVSVQGEIDLLSRQLSRYSGESLSAVDEVRRSLLDLVERFDRTTSQVRDLDMRIDEFESLRGREAEFSREQMMTLHRELSSLTRYLDRNSGNEARLLEHLEQVVGDLRNRIAALEESEAAGNAEAPMAADSRGLTS